MDELDAMNVEYLSTGSLDCPLIRVFGINPEETRAFRNAVLELATGARSSVSTEEIFGEHASINCRLTMCLGEKNSGPSQMGSRDAFEWVLPTDGWKRVSDLLEPFVTTPTEGAYQWLDDADVGEISVLFSFSENGHW